jgi:hypothetical protein
LKRPAKRTGLVLTKRVTWFTLSAVIVKESYYGRSIFCVTEVNCDGKTAYLIVLEDRTTWLHIKIVGDEMIEEKLFTKG